ncbi:MAG: ATP-dependent DNA helicase RecG [Clostridia bacterium]|nr:ATP-dependent DNA helicase RecG [Clostridia bacterium]
MEKISTLYGIGDRRAKIFEKKGIKTVEELLYYFPRAYEDRTKFCDIRDVKDGEYACISATVYSPVRETRIRKNFNIYQMTVFDDSGQIKAVWYNNRFVKGLFQTGDKVLFYGKISVKGRNKELENPVYERREKQHFIGKIVPIYPLWSNMTQKTIASAMEEALKSAGMLQEYIPSGIREKYAICEINYAMKNIHFPESFYDYQSARKRFVFEELFFLRLALLEKRRKNEQEKRTPFSDTECADEFVNSLPYALTNAQKRVLYEILADFKKDTPMNRLLEGDVGSGKTVVSAAAMYVTYKNGCQSVIMAPTEILAFQHYETFSEFFSGLDIKIVLLTKSTKNKSAVYEKIKNGEYDIIIGTNAVISDKVAYKNLGLCVTDEQHRFGVSQRARLTEKGENPNSLIMTATPIPRTLSLILCGDLDISVLDELPPGRKPVLTYAVGGNMRKRVYAFVQKNVKSGMQAYVVCPLIEESETQDLKNAQNIFLGLTKAFPDLKIGLIHGRMKSSEKDAVMQEFLDGKIDVLVSTTVIEVGVNVPNSNIMVIENAERFGLATLHQLRGRVGRGNEQAYCIMIADADNELTKQRMKTMCDSNDGFYIAEQDLKQRGPGDFFGTRQHGLPEMRIANLFKDSEILKLADSAVCDVLEQTVKMTSSEAEILFQKASRIIPESVILN